jgi:thymidylate kinase
LFELLRYYSWIVDRFHLSTQMYQYKTYGRRYDFRWMEERLKAIGFRIVFCTRSENSFSAARNARLKISGNPAQYDDLHIFINEQRILQELINESILPVLTVDISDNKIDRVVLQIADWLEQNGGLYIN